MCTTISTRAEVSGSAKGPHGWFHFEHVQVGYDHPTHVSEEHAVLLDVVDGSRGVERVAVELSREAARELAHRLLRTLEAADDYEADGA
jgi:hypothetical protein